MQRITRIFRWQLRWEQPFTLGDVVALAAIAVLLTLGVRLALGVLSAENLRGELLELWTSGNIPSRAILMVSHNIDEAVQMADRILVMDKDPGRTRGLPDVQANELAALLEHVAELPGDRADVYRLADDLGVEMGPLLRLIETAELLGFATIEEGDLTLTPLGETFAEASILARKEIFATRVRRVPLFRWLTNPLRAAERQQLKSEIVQTALELEFPPEEANRQLETIISWGRYAEILAFDDDDDTLYLEPGSSPVVPAG